MRDIAGNEQQPIRTAPPCLPAACAGAGPSATLRLPARRARPCPPLRPPARGAAPSIALHPPAGGIAPSAALRPPARGAAPSAPPRPPGDRTARRTIELLSPSATRRQRGVTLMEMMVVVALMGLLVGITFPSVTAGIESVRLASAADSVASYLNAAVNWADRRQEAVEIEFNRAENRMSLRSAGPDFHRSLELPSGVEFLRILPEIPAEPDAPRRFIIYPAGAVPRIAVELENRKGGRRLVQVDPITGAPRIERPRDNP